MRVRKNAHRFEQVWDPILLWYAKAVREMQSRDIRDPTSWRYQAAIHAYNRQRDPLRVEGEQLPSTADQQRFWTRCQHGSWFFLPWHRAYLLNFERIVAATILSLNGPGDWALPFWDYSDPDVQNPRRIPAAFTERRLPDNTDNPLFLDTPRRAPTAVSGQPVGFPDDADITECLGKNFFTNNGVVEQFGGGQTGFSHGGGVAGACEVTPHASMHGAVGGLSGWMSAFHTAALDPIFWFHHANIDRLWELWRRRDINHTDPVEALWRTGVSFDFHDHTGAVVTITSSQMVDLSSSLLDYDYEGLPPRPVPLGGAPIPGGDVSRQRSIPEMVGATSASITLGGEPSATSLAMVAPVGPAAAPAGTEGAADVTRTIHLVLENIQAPEYPIESYLVYINLPAEANPDEYMDRKAGVLPRFGVVEASQPDNEHGGTGLNISYDITRIVNVLQQRGEWNLGELQVRFVPMRGVGDRVGEAGTQPVRVGRVSLYFS